MAIFLRDRTNLRGSSTRVRGNRADLRNSEVGYSTSSMNMNNNRDRILLFKGRNWQENVMFRTGVNSIDRTGRPADGGKTGFNNGIRSARITNFNVRVNYHVIRDANGNFPGGIANRTAMNTYINSIHGQINTIWNRSFINFINFRTNIHDSDRFFNMRRDFVALLLNRSMSTRRDSVDLFLVNSIGRGTLGTAVSARLSTKLMVNVRRTRTNNATGGAARTLAHEIGHTFSLGHGSNSVANNLMTQTGSGGTGTRLTVAQVERVHRKISYRTGDLRNLRRE